MPTRNLLYVPDLRLRQRAEEVAQVDDTIRQLVKDMFLTMYAEDGCGLAAPQIGVMKRIFILDMAMDDEAPQPLVFINPEITWRSAQMVSMPESCLSIPDISINIERPAEVEVRALNEHGVHHTVKGDGWLARGIQHEYDHLDGKTTLDHVSALKQKMILGKVRRYLAHAREA